MIILNTGYTASVTVGNGESLTVESRGGTTVTADSGLLGTVDGVMTFGPFSSAAKITVTALGGDCAYQVNPTIDIKGVKNADGNAVGFAVAGITYPLMPPRSTPLRVAGFGDSTADTWTTQQPDTHDTTLQTAPFPALNLATTLGSAQADNYSLQMHYPQAYMVFNGGIGGQTTTQMLARDGLAAGVLRGAIIDLLERAPDVVLLRAGSINDLTPFTAATLTQSVIDAVYVRHIEIIDRLLTGKVKIIDSGFLGYSAAAGTLADQDARRAALVGLNSRFAAYAALLPGQVEFLSTTGIVSDSTGRYYATATTDGTHLNQWGQYLFSKEEARICEKLFGVSAKTRYPGINLFSNHLFNTSVVQSYGTEATGYTIAVNAGTRQNAKIETIDGQRFQTAEFTITGASGFGRINFPYDASTIGFVAGDKLGLEFDFIVRGVNGAKIPALTALNMQLITYKSAAGRIHINGMVPIGAITLDGTEYRGHGVTNPFEMTESSANLTNGSLCYITLFCDVIGTSFKMGIANPRLVKLNVARSTLGDYTT